MVQVKHFSAPQKIPNFQFSRSADKLTVAGQNTWRPPFNFMSFGNKVMNSILIVKSRELGCPETQIDQYCLSRINNSFELRNFRAQARFYPDGTRDLNINLQPDKKVEPVFVTDGEC